MKTIEVHASEFERIGACPGCDGLKGISEAVEQLLQASTTVTYLVPSVDGSVNNVCVPRGSVLDEPRPVRVQKVLDKIATRMLDDPLRCGGGCVLGDGGEVFWTTLDEVDAERRQSFRARKCPPPTIDDDYFGEISESTDDPITRFVKDILPD